MEDTAVASKKLEIVREKGCRIAVDDFGTGYCSLNLLQSLPVDYLKIDKCFIDTLTSAGAEAPVLDTIISLSKRLGLTTIAEGVSTTHQRNWLLENRVPYVQGYLYGRPMAVPEFMAWYVANESNNPVKKDDALRIVLDKYRANGCPCGGQVKLWPVLLDHYNRSCAVPPAASRYTF